MVVFPASLVWLADVKMGHWIYKSQCHLMPWQSTHNAKAKTMNMDLWLLTVRLCMRACNPSVSPMVFPWEKPIGFSCLQTKTHGKYHSGLVNFHNGPRLAPCESASLLDRPCMGWNPEINLEAVTLKKPLIKKIPAKHLSVHLCVYIYICLVVSDG